MSARPTYWTAILRIVLLVAFLFGLGIANARFAQSAQDANEFLPRWESAHAWLTQGLSPYDPQVSLSAQRRLYGREADPKQGEDLALFADPLPSLLLYAPWGLLDYPAARAGWMTLLEIMLVIAGLLALRIAAWRPPSVLFALMVALGVAWSPGVRSIVAGQAAILSLVLSLTAITCIERGWDLAAGAAMGLAGVDPLVGLIVLLAGLAWAGSRRRWGIIGAALSTVGLLVAVSLLLMPSWPLEWLRQVSILVHSQASLGASWGLPSRFLGAGPGVLVTFFVLATLWTIWTCLGKGTRWFVWSIASLLVLGSWLTRLMMESSSLVYLLPAVILILAGIGQRVPRAGRWIAAVGVILLGGGSWAVVLSGAAATGGVIQTSIAPALAGIGLLWVRWWVTRGADVRLMEFEGADAV